MGEIKHSESLTLNLKFRNNKWMFHCITRA